jgi:hypothetical protein
MDTTENMSNPNNEFAGGTQPGTMPYIVFSLGWILLSYSIVFIFDFDDVRNLTREDAFVEYVGAALFLMASVAFFLLYKRSRQISMFAKISFKGNIFYLLLGLAFLFVCLEEISWGQRIIGFQTPEGIREINAQSEFNIHNLTLFHWATEAGDRKDFWGLLLNMDRLFSVFWFSYCCLIPVLYRFSSPIRAFMDRVRMPIVPLFLGAFFILNYAVMKVLDMTFPIEFHVATVEIKESNIGMLFFVVALWFMRTDRYPASDSMAAT